MTSRDAILTQLRAAVGGDRPDSGQTPRAVLSVEGDRAFLGKQFGRNLEAVGGSFDVVPERRQVLEHIVQLAARWSEGTAHREILSWAPEHIPIDGMAPALEAAGIDVIIPTTLDDDATRARAARVPVGITAADAAIASTGSLVLFAGPGKARVTSLLPLYHLALVPLSRIHASIERWMESVRRQGDTSAVLADAAQIVFVTGPSKSADIELRLTLGVHGPRVVHAVIFDDGPSGA